MRQTAWSILTLSMFLSFSVLLGQDPTGVVQGHVIDASGGAIESATVTVKNLQTGAAFAQRTGRDGTFSFPVLAAGEYEVSVEATNFSQFVQRPIRLNVDQTIRLPIRLDVATGRETVVVEGDAPLVDTSTNTLGRVVSTQQIIDLPLNGRNFTQLGLLQAGVAPLTQGLEVGGGSLRSGQAYAVNGQRPESNNYLVDGARTVNRVDGGYAIRVPVDAIAEFKILTHTAPAEYGWTSGATTSLVTRSGSNSLHGVLYEFLRNDTLDARNFFSRDVEPLKQNQFGGALGGPVRENKAFFFGYYEGFRNRQGITRSAVVPTPEQKQGDFSKLVDPTTGQPRPLINYLSGEPFPNNRIPAPAISAISQEVQKFYPNGNVSPSIFSSTEVMENDSDQAGAKVDLILSESDNFSLRQSYSTTANVNPLSVRGGDLPGFPVGDDISTWLFALSETHLFSPYTVNSFRAAYFRHDFLFDKRFNRTPPRSLGFQYDSTLEIAQGPPFFIVNGYSSVGNPITGPRESVQNTFEIYDSISRIAGKHNFKFGGEFRRTQINAAQGIASNGFFVFAPFPFSDPYATFLTGNPVVFFQVGGDMRRGLRNWDLAGFAQDEWRVSRNFTLNLGLRYELSTPFGEIRNRLNAFAPGRQSTVVPSAPRGLLFPGDDGVGDRIADIYNKGFAPRIGFAWDPTGTGKFSIRSGYGIFYDGFTNGASGVFQAPISALPWTQAYQVPGPFLNYANPLGAPPFDTKTFPQPTTVLTVDQTMRPTYAQNWNLALQRSFGEYLLELRYVGTKGTHIPRFIEANPAVFGPGATAQNADRRRLYAGCDSPTAPCDFASVGLIVNATSSTYHAGQLSFSRRYSSGAGFWLSYWYSKSLDYVSTLNVAGSAPRLVSGENDLPQDPFNWAAEHGPSLFDAAHRLTFSFLYEIPGPKTGAARAVLGDWQFNGILNLTSGTPFTVYDTSNVSLQGSHPEITGFFSSRPDLVADPNDGPKTVEAWLNRSAFRRLDPLTQAGRFGSAGRNIARGPSFGNIDLSLMKNFSLSETVRLQFRLEGFNVTNHPNFAVPVNDMASPQFGRILLAGPPRLLQFGLKLIF